MSVIHRNLISAVESGQILDLSQPEEPRLLLSIPDKVDRPDVPPAAKISADMIRKILLGSIPGESGSQVKVTTAGIRIKAATIRGDLNLDDLAGAGGSALPALHFHGCWFDNEKGISLKRSHLRSLSLNACKVTELQAEEAVIDGPVKLSDIRRPAPITLKDRSCKNNSSLGSYVVLRGAQIGGHVDCARASFAIVPRREGEEEPFVLHSKHPRYALDLRATQVLGSVLLRPGVTACGGISFTLSQIQGSIWCNGAKLTAVEEWAFSADYADIQGSLYLRTYDPPDGSKSVRFVAKGQVSLFATKLGGSLYMQGADLQKCEVPQAACGEDEKSILDATNATIGGNCELGCWQSFRVRDKIFPFEAKGRILLGSVSVRNSVSFQGAHVESVHADNITVGGDFDMSVYDPSPPVKSHNHESFRVTAVDVHLERAAINGHMLMYGARLGKKDANPDKEQGLIARRAKIGGNCHLTVFPYENAGSRTPVRFECYGRILLQEGSIGNSLVMAGAKLKWTLPGPDAVVDFSGTTIGGHAKFMTWQPNNIRMRSETNNCMPFEIEAPDTALRLAGTKIAQKLILNGAIIKASKVAINASNIEIGGKASLGAYDEKTEDENDLPTIYPFEAFGSVILSAATIKLGLDMSGALIKPPLPETDTYDARSLSDLRALDLTLAHVKFAELCGLRLSEVKNLKEKRKESLKRLEEAYPFEANGQVILKHAEIDSDVNLSWARFQGRLVADHARIGASVYLTHAQFWSGSNQAKYEEILERRSEMSREDRLRGGLGSQTLLKELKEKEAREAFATRHAVKKANADISLHLARIGGALIVGQPQIFREFGSVRGCHISVPNYVTVDLRGLCVEELTDDNGNGWGTSVRLWLDGFCYTRFRTAVDSEADAGRLRKLVSISRHGRDEKLEQRVQWLNLQYFNENEPRSGEFTPGAYEHLVKILKVDGLYDDARRITSERLTKETRLSPKLSRKFFWGLFHFLFDYGFSPFRAFCTLVLCIGIGWGAAYVADYGVPWFPNIPVGRVLYVNHSLPDATVNQSAGNSTKLDLKFDEQQKTPCEGRIQPLLYAIDVFVPVLNLRQQTACSISHESFQSLIWRYAQAAYAVLGWFLTPLALLTFSGILKKHLEK